MRSVKIQERLRVALMRLGSGFEAYGIRGSDAAMDPFLMVDHYRMTQPTFGPHPHAGFSAVTYMFEDAQTGFKNRDSLGNASDIRPGDNYWTVAGAGVMHDEVPMQNGQTAHGLQLFVNLAGKAKHMPPGTVYIERERMPSFTQSGGAQVKLVFGAYTDATRSIAQIEALPTPASLLDVQLPAQQSFDYPIPAGTNVFVYVVRGSVSIEEEPLTQNAAAALGRAGGQLCIKSAEGAQFALFLGLPLDEPVLRQGPFAMSNAADLAQAVADFQAGKMGRLV